MKINIIFCLTLLILFSCKVERNNNCHILLLRAKENLNIYYEKKDTNYLRVAKECLDSITCVSYEKRIFNTKTTILLLLKNYKEGVKYISSLDSTFFERSYMKSMYLNRFKALERESMLDTIHRNQYYNEGLCAIFSYMNKHPTDKETLVEYYFFKILFNDHTEVVKEVEALKKQKIFETDFLDALIETLNELNK